MCILSYKVEAFISVLCTYAVFDDCHSCDLSPFSCFFPLLFSPFHSLSHQPFCCISIHSWLSHPYLLLHHLLTFILSFPLSLSFSSPVSSPLSHLSFLYFLFPSLLQVVPEYVHNPDLKYNQILVPTVDTVRSKWLLQLMTSIKHPILFVGEPGTSKTATVSSFLRELDQDSHVSNFYTSCGEGFWPHLLYPLILSLSICLPLYVSLFFLSLSLSLFLSLLSGVSLACY